MLAVLVLDRLHALALLGPRDDRDRLAGRGLGLGVGGLDRVHVVAVDRDRLPAERLDPAHVAVEVPAEHRLARLAEPVDVDDRGQVVEPLPAGVLEGLPHRALGHLGVAAQHPHAVGQLVQRPARHRDADADRQALAERAGGHVGRRDPRRGVALEPRVELAERQQLLVVDRADRLQDRVVERRRVALGEDQVVVGRVVRVGVVELAGARRSAPPSGRRRTSRRSGGRSRPRPTCGRSRPAAAGRVRADRSRRHQLRAWTRGPRSGPRSDLANFSTPSRSSVCTTSS